jgi:hypothetical protein
MEEKNKEEVGLPKCKNILFSNLDKLHKRSTFSSEF